MMGEEEEAWWAIRRRRRRRRRRRHDGGGMVCLFTVSFKSYNCSFAAFIVLNFHIFSMFIFFSNNTYRYFF